MSKTELAEALDMDAVVAGQRRLTPSEALRLYREASLPQLGRWATAVADRKMGECGGAGVGVGNGVALTPSPQSGGGEGDSPQASRMRGECSATGGVLYPNDDPSPGGKVAATLSRTLAPGVGSLGEGQNAAPSRIRTYVIDRNINYTNVCSAACTFCAFKRDLGAADAYTLSTAQLHQKIAELVNIGGTQILLQGGMNPELPIEFYEDMLRGIKAEFPGVHVHGFSPPEFVEFVAIFQLDNFPVTAPGESHTLPWDIWCAKLEAILRRLMAAGLDSIPGGGGEIFAEAVRRRIGVGKASAKQWLEVMATAHRLGMFTSATMMFGHIEGVADRIDHINRVRAAQDRALAAGWAGRYVSFIAWPFQRENTPLGRVKEWDYESGAPFPGDVLAEGGGNPGAHQDAGKRLRLAGASDYLRTQAVARLFLDNIHSIGSSWVTMGPHIGQLGLFFGASDMGSVMMEENVVSAAGTTYCLNEAVLCRLIRDCGYLPAQRDNRYRFLKVHEGVEAPDRRVTDWSTQRRATAGIG